MIADAGLRSVCTPQKSGRGPEAQQVHRADQERQARSPSGRAPPTSRTGGIFGHSNVGHIVRRSEVAAHISTTGTRSATRSAAARRRKPFGDTRTDPGRQPDAGTTRHADARGKSADRTITALFSPRDEDDAAVVRRRMARPSEIVCMTVAFNLDDGFEPCLRGRPNVCGIVLFDKQLTARATARSRRTTTSCSPPARSSRRASCRTSSPRSSPASTGTPTSTTSSCSSIPWATIPPSITGSANFSGASQINNDENMLVIRSDQRVADIYFGEFMRIFDHLYARYLAKKIKEAEEGKAEARREGLERLPAAGLELGGRPFRRQHRNRAGGSTSTARGRPRRVP